MTKKYELVNDRAGFCGSGIDLCGDTLDSVFPGACTHEHLTIIVSTQRSHRKDECAVKVERKAGCVSMIRIRGEKHQLLYETFETIKRDFPQLPTLYVQMKFSGKGQFSN